MTPSPRPLAVHLLFLALLILPGMGLPASVPEERFPVSMFKAEDIERARENIERFEWARNTYNRLKEKTEPYLELDEAELRSFVPHQTPFLSINCPDCGAGPHYWADLIDGGNVLQCRAEGCLFPHDPDVETEEWDIHGLIRYKRLEHILLDLENLGIVYQIEGDRVYAEKARPVILEFAKAYPKYRVNMVNRNVFTDNDEYYGKIAGWKWRDGLLVGRALLTYDLIRSSGVFSEREVEKIEDFLRYTRDHYLDGYGDKGIAGARAPQDQGSVWWCLAALGALLGDQETMGLMVEAFEEVFDPANEIFHSDGTFYQSTPNYNWMFLAAVTGIPEVLQGNITPAIYDNPRLAILEDCYTWFLDALHPNGALPAFNDAHVGRVPDPLGSEVAYAAFQNPRALYHLQRVHGPNLQGEITIPEDATIPEGLTGLFVDFTGLNRYGLFFRDPDIAGDGQVEPYAVKSRHFTGLRTMILRDDHFPPMTTMGMLGYQTFLPSAHMQPDYLDINLYAHGLEMVGKVGYPLYPRWALRWIRSPLSHQTVTELQPFTDVTEPLVWQVSGGPRLAEAGAGGHSSRFLGLIPFDTGAPVFLDITRLEAGLESYTWNLRGRSDHLDLLVPDGPVTVIAPPLETEALGDYHSEPADMVEPLPLPGGRESLSLAGFEAIWRFDEGRSLRTVFPNHGSPLAVSVAAVPPEQDDLERHHLAGNTFKPGTLLPRRALLRVNTEGPSARIVAVHVPMKDGDGDGAPGVGGQTEIRALELDDPSKVAVIISRGNQEYLVVHDPTEGRTEVEGLSMEGRVGVVETVDGDLRSMTLAGGGMMRHSNVVVRAGANGNASYKAE